MRGFVRKRKGWIERPKRWIERDAETVEAEEFVSPDDCHEPESREPPSAQKSKRQSATRHVFTVPAWCPWCAEREVWTIGKVVKTAEGMRYHKCPECGAKFTSEERKVRV